MKCDNGGDEKNCTVCKNNLYLIEEKCQHCPTTKYFEKKDEMKCLKCDSSCDTCNGEGPESCLMCKEGFYFHNENGKKLCKECKESDGFFIDSDSFCKPCTDPCATCNGINTN